MNTIKTSILTLIAAVVIFFGYNVNSYSSETAAVMNTSEIRKPGPKYIWVAGHFKINKHGKSVWVPGHWKRI